MKKILFGLLILAQCQLAHAVINVSPFLRPDDLTMQQLETQRVTFQSAINNADGGLLIPGSVSADSLTDNANPVNRWNEAFNDWVYDGLLPPTSTDLISITTAGTAYINGQRVVKDATSHTYTASKETYVDLSSNGTFTYTEKSIGSAEPAVTDNSIRLAKVTTDADNVTTVRDDRVLAITLGSNQEDFTRSGLTIQSIATPDDIVINSGILYHGTTRISKTSTTSLALDTASDWATGISGRTTSDFGFVVMNSLGSIKLTRVRPTLSDISGNSDGKFRYCLIGSDYWRVLAWFYMNSTGSGNLDYSYGNFKDGGESNGVFVSADDDVTTTSTANFITLDDMTLYFYSSGGAVNISDKFFGANSVASKANQYIVYVDSVSQDSSIVGLETNSATSASWREWSSTGMTYMMPKLTQDDHTIQVQWRTETNTGTTRYRTLGVWEI